MQLGMLAVVSSALAVTASVVLGRTIVLAELPFWSMVCVGDSMALIVFAASFVWSRSPLPRRSQAAWVAIRTVFRTLGFVAALVAVRVGATPGDIAPLSSINTVVAAVTGHYFLSEKMRPVHVSALAFTVAGAVLVTQPAFLFGGDRESSPYLGYSLAIAAGFMKAGDCITARKAPEVSASVGSACATFLAISFYIGLAVSAGEPRSLGAIHIEPWALILAVLAWFIIDFVAIATGTVGSVMCPAAVSATLYTGSSIVFGYASQVLLFDLVPGAFTLTGAALLLSAVGIMSATRVQPIELPANQISSAVNDQMSSAVNDTVSTADTASTSSTVGAASALSAVKMWRAAHPDEYETENFASIVSFMATEFAAVLADSETETMQMRRQSVQGGRKQATQTIGVMSAAAEETIQ